MKILDLIQKITASAVSWFPLTFCIALCVGVTMGTTFDAEALAAFQLTNKLNDALLNSAIQNSAIWMVVVFVLFGVGVTALKLLKNMAIEDAIHLINKFATILLVLPIFISFEATDLAKDHPFATLFGCFSIAAIAAIYFYRLPGINFEKLPIKADYYKWISIGVVVIAATAFAITITRFSIQHIQNLRAGSFDLGVYINTLWNTARGDLLRCTFVNGGYHIYAHFDPILVLFSPIMWFDPKFENAIVTQSVWMALGVIPLYLISIHHLKKHWVAAILCFAYLLYPGIHGPSMYDFHSITLAGPMILWSLYFADTKRIIPYFVSIVMLLFTREDLGLTMFFVGFYLFYSKQAIKTGLATMGICLAYYFAITRTVMATDETFSYDYYFEALYVGNRPLAESLVVTLLTNPMFIVRQAFTEAKLEYIIQLLLPLAALPLFAGKKRFVFFYGVAVTALVTKPAVYNIAYQYSTFMYPFFFALTPVVLKNIAEGDFFSRLGLDTQRVLGAVMAFILAASIGVSWNYGVFRESSAFKDGQSHFDRNPTEFQINRYKTVQKIQKMIPQEASVSASKMVGAHFATRAHIYRFKELKDTEYYILLDKDMASRKFRDKFKRFLRDNRYDLILQENEIMLFIRKDLNKGEYPVLRVKHNRRPTI
ncbi:MAG: DUF2079 domain-containing protein [Deltaproteobacteria bacterium]|nr:DUF2079 domain-containing protein [Deltaproteobacteria bacterium]